MPDVFAAIPAKDEEDIIGHIVRHLVEQGVRVVVMDDNSTDETAARAHAAGATIEPMPEWNGVYGFTGHWLQRVVRERPRWGIIMAADEVIRHRGGLALPEGLKYVEMRGYNCVNLWRRDYVPVEGEPVFTEGDPEAHFRYFHEHHNEPHRYPRLFRVDVAKDYRTSDLHTVDFEGKNVLDDGSFLLKHYPLRSIAHAQRKIRQRLSAFESWATVQYNRRPFRLAMKRQMQHDLLPRTGDS
jgi:glycosyltransferase involved in cell wall biosynthesis